MPANAVIAWQRLLVALELAAAIGVPGVQLGRALLADDQDTRTLAQVLGTGLGLVAVDLDFTPEAAHLLDFALLVLAVAAEHDAHAGHREIAVLAGHVLELGRITQVALADEKVLHHSYLTVLF